MRKKTLTLGIRILRKSESTWKKIINLIPYPGTRLYDHCLERGFILSNTEKDVFLGSGYQIETKEFDKMEDFIELLERTPIIPNFNKKEDLNKLDLIKLNYNNFITNAHRIHYIVKKG